MSESLKKKLVIGSVVVIVILGFSYLNSQRQKELDTFIQMQAAPLQKAQPIEKSPEK